MKGLLKFLTCGSVDDGKSTLIGHMLYDAKLLYTDQKKALELDSKVGSRNGEIDYSLLLDGLMAEREQGITIDVAYRYFATGKRSFIVADTPGHEEYTRNMAVGASFAELAVILVDASKGLLTQTWRHARICALMGIQNFVFAVNKIDLVHYDEVVFKKISKDVRKLAVDLDLDLNRIDIIPVSATEGDNLTKKSMSMPWYKGQSLLRYLEEVDVEENVKEEGFIFPVQCVCRPNYTFRGFQGEVASGVISEGDEVLVLPSKEKVRILQIFIGKERVEHAYKGQPITVQLDREVDISRGCVLVREAGVKVADMFNADILWMDEDSLVQGRSFWVKIGTKLVPAVIMAIKYKINIHTGENLKADKVRKNEIAICDFALAEKTVMDSFASHRAMGRFIVIDRITNMTSACGIINYPLRRSENLTWQALDINRELRASQMEQKPLTLWFTGLSGAGKSTLANEVEKRLYATGKHTMLLDGDNVRMGLNKNLGFQEKDRVENIRRIAEVAKLMNDAGLIVLVALISPWRADRQSAREIIGKESFLEVYVSTPLEECEKRDVKGLYRKARQGEIPNFTGISSPFESPETPWIEIDTSIHTLEECVDCILETLNRT